MTIPLSSAMQRRAEVLQAILGVDYQNAAQAVADLYGGTGMVQRTAAHWVDTLSRIDYLQRAGGSVDANALLKAEVLSAKSFPSGFNLTPGKTPAAVDAYLDDIVNGAKNLSNDIWQVKGKTRERIGKTIADGIRAGKKPNQIALELEKYMYSKWRPKRDRSGQLTSPMQGRVATANGRGYASYEARRLVRTEITKAHSAIVESATVDSPIPLQADWVVAAFHANNHSCDELAAGSPYDIDSMPKPPAHPNCMCRIEIRFPRGYAAAVRDIAKLIEDEFESDVDWVEE